MKGRKTMMTYHRTLHTFLFMGAIIATTLTLLIGATAFKVPGFSMLSFAKEAPKTTVQAQSLCISHPNSQNCTNQDPVVQGCDKDAQTVAFVQITDPHSGYLIATVQRRYSPSCHAEWGRMINNGNQPLQLTVNNNTRSTTGKFVYSMMVFVPNLSVAPQIIGTASTNGIDPAHGGPGFVGVIPALPPTQN
jgi:hypothetical protein